MADAYELLAPAIGDRVNKAYLDYLQDGIDRACEDHYMVVPIMQYNASGFYTTSRFGYFVPPVTLIPKAMRVVYHGGGVSSNTVVRLDKLVAGVGTTIATADPPSGATSGGETTTFSENLVAGTEYGFDADDQSGSSTATSGFVILRYALPVTRETFTDDASTLTAAALNALEANVVQSGKARVLAFAPIIGPTDTGNAVKARFKMPDPGAGYSWKVSRLALSVSQMSATGSTPSVRYALYDAAGTITSADVTATGSSLGARDVLASVDPSGLTLTAGNEYTLRLVSAGGTSPTILLLVVYLWLDLVITPQTWTTGDFLAANAAGTQKLQALDKAIQTTCRWHMMSAGYVNGPGGGDVAQGCPTSNPPRIIIEQIQTGYRFTSLSSESYQVRGAANGRSLSCTVSQNAGTFEGLAETTSETALGDATPDTITAHLFSGVSAVATVTYLNVILFFEVGPTLISKTTTLAATPTLPIVGTAIVNRFNLGTLRTTTEALALAEAARRFDTTRKTTDLVTLAGDAERHLARAPSLEVLTLAPLVARSATRGLVDEAFTLAEGALVRATTKRTAEAFTLNAAVTRAAQLVLAELVTLTPAVARAATRSLTDEAFSLADSSHRSTTAMSLDAFTLAEAALIRESLHRAALETFTISDGDAREYVLRLTEALALSIDTQRATTHKVTPEGFALIERAIKSLTHPLADEAFGLLDATAKLSVRRIQREVFTLADANVQRHVSRDAIETFTLSDSSTRHAARTLEETLTLRAVSSLKNLHADLDLIWFSAQDLALQQASWMNLPGFASIQDIIDSVKRETRTAGE